MITRTGISFARPLTSNKRSPRACQSMTAEIYDPGSGTWSMTGSMAVSRSSHTVTLLANGNVLGAGGENFNGVIQIAEVYLP
jgi:N-acetylneuraminic acid mutarotase